MKKILIMGLCFLGTKVWALEAQLIPNPIMQGESTELVIRSDKPLSTPENLKELTPYFMIAGQQQRQSSQFVNGVGSTTYELAFVLFPLRQGEIQVPALKIGNETTSPLTLKVVDRKQEKTKEIPLLELSADVSDHTPYVGQTIFYTLTLTDGQGVLDGEIIPAKVEKGRLTPIGQDKANSVIKNGQRVREIERTYTLVPDQAGVLQIAPALFNGQVAYQAPHPTNKRKFFGIADAATLFENFFNTSRPISLTSNPVTIKVQPKPNEISGWWLPSPKVELTADYQIPEIIQVGDTISGKLILTAQDINANDMPVPRLKENASFRLYPQPEERTTSMQGNHLQGQVSVPFMLIPLKEGQMEIPEISVGWFNTNTKKQEKAVVPARPIMVEQGAIAPVLKPTPQENSAPISVQIEQPSSQPEKTSHSWIWILLGIGIGLLTGTFLSILWHQRKKHKEKPLPDFYPFS